MAGFCYKESMQKKIRVGLVFGGQSVEHEVSIVSARNILNALSSDLYEVVLIGIDKQGQWHLPERHIFQLENAAALLADQQESSSRSVAIALQRKEQFVALASRSGLPPLDVVFPVLHGSNGEDGTVQGLLQLAGIPFVGSGVLASALCMDKDVMKRVCEHSGIRVAKWLSFRSREIDKISYEEIRQTLGEIVFVKPANAGSSVGVSKVRNSEQLDAAVREAFAFDKKIVIEEYVKGREIECSVLGNEEPIASIPGEIVPTHEFYSYAAKYLDDSGAELKVPADLESSVVERVRSVAVQAYQLLECEGMARVDFFLSETGELVLNEINTIPGFTNISMYPKLWEATGISYSQLLEKLIGFALERHHREKQIRKVYG